MEETTYLLEDDSINGTLNKLDKKSYKRLKYNEPNTVNKQPIPKKYSYLFTGKVSLFPLIILFLAAGATALLLYGEKKYNGGYFESNEFYYGLAGLILFVACLILLMIIVFWLVIKITFEITSRKIKIEKRGVFRSSILEFDIKESSIHYFRTHFSEDQCWLQLVIREGSTFYSIFSWKGKGSQYDNFHRLFNSLRESLKEFKSNSNNNINRPLNSSGNNINILSNRGMNIRKDDFADIYPVEIVSKDEFTIIGPFTQKLKLYAYSQQKNSKERRMEMEKKRDEIKRSRPLCAEDIPILNYDSFFRHFKHSKYLDDDNNNDLYQGSNQIGEFISNDDLYQSYENDKQRLILLDDDIDDDLIERKRNDHIEISINL